MKKIIYIILAVLLLVGVMWGVSAITQARSNDRIDAIHKELKASQDREAALVTERDKWKEIGIKSAEDSLAIQAKADAAEARAKVSGKKVAELEAKLVALPPQKPATDPQSLPATAKGVAEGFTAQGFPPALQDTSTPLAFTLDQGRPILGLVIDGKAYPSALERIGLLEEDVDGLHTQNGALEESLGLEKEAMGKAREAFTEMAKAETACEQQVGEAHKQIGLTQQEKAEVEKKLKAQTRKTWLAGAGGIALGILIVLL